MFENFVLKPLLNSLASYKAENAFCIGDKFFSYEDLAHKVSAIRSELKKNQLKSPTIGLVVNDDIETYASIIAIWLEGLAYVPLHPQQPIDRIEEIISQAKIQLTLDSGSHFNLSTEVIKTAQLVFSQLDLNPRDVASDSLAYILFTSGSTGKPKGVPITRKNVGSFMKAFWATGISLDHSDRCLQCFDLTFDVSVQSFLAPLTRGACTYTIPHDQIKYSYVFGLLEDHKLTFGSMAPSMVRFLRPYFGEIMAPSMRYNILTAEASPIDLIQEWSTCIPNAEIFNFYGPTEATIYCTFYKYERSTKQLNGLLSIGKPMEGVTVVIIDEQGKLLPKNEKGELCVSGDQLTSGYWENPEKNQEVFFEMNIENKAQRFYKTGDLCFMDDDGDIMYSGRLDFQVKIQGYRVELGEIEYHSRQYLNGKNAVAIAITNTVGNAEIVLFVEGQSGSDGKILSYLKEKVPSYMIPAKVIVKTEFPINTNGKVDRKVLKQSLNG